VRTVTVAGPAKSSESAMVPTASIVTTDAYAMAPKKTTPRLIAISSPLLGVLTFIFDLLLLSNQLLVLKQTGCCVWSFAPHH
jgi:hypothetical protein